MANQRAAGQKILPIPVSDAFLREINAALKKLKIPNRSQFVREAIQEKLQLQGIRIPDELLNPPDRIGKGGRASLTKESGSQRKAQVSPAYKTDYGQRAKPRARQQSDKRDEST